MEDRGFGFITGSDGKDVFVHVNRLPDSIRREKTPPLSPGDRVAFELVEDRRGWQAKVIGLCSEPDVLTEDKFLDALDDVFEDESSWCDRHGEMLLTLARSHGWIL